MKRFDGFTLLELILVMVLLGIAAIMIVPFVGHIFSNLLEGRELSQRESQATLALERFIRDVREGKEITISNDDLEMTITLEKNGTEIELIYGIDLDEGTLWVNEKPLARHLVAGSRFDEETNTNSYMLILEIQMPNNESFELSASAFSRMISEEGGGNQGGGNQGGGNQGGGNQGGGNQGGGNQGGGNQGGGNQGGGNRGG